MNTNTNTAPAPSPEPMRLLFLEAMEWGRFFWAQRSVPDITLREVSQDFADKAALSAAAQPPAPDDHISMPKYWSVEVNADGEQLLSIGENWLSGQKKLEEQDEKTIIGAARHLLSFVGYGLPASSFDPDEDTAATPKPIKTSSPEIPDNCAAAPKATKAEPVQPERVLLSEEQITEIWSRKPRYHAAPIGYTDLEFARDIEAAAHGIQPAHKEQPNG